MTEPWLDDGDVQLYHGDVVDCLRALPAGSVQTCVTSPPYWGLRDYGTGEWTGGNAECDHARQSAVSRASSGLQGATTTQGGAYAYGDVCGRCGARRVDAQIGLEPTPQAYVERLVAVFREVYRVLRDDGTLWLNLGDSYAQGHGGSSTEGKGITIHKQSRAASEPRERDDVDVSSWSTRDATPRNVTPGLKPKDLCMIPARVALALQADGWYLRSDIIWAKPNPMPESVTDRPTKAHEYVFLLSKRPRYYWDADAIREEWTTDRMPGRRVNETQHYGAQNGGNGGLTGQLAAVKARLREQARPQVDSLLDAVDGAGIGHVNADGGVSGRAGADVVAERFGGGVHVDADAVADEVPGAHFAGGRVPVDRVAEGGAGADGESVSHKTIVTHPAQGRNARSVWEIATQPFPEAHFATFPEELARRCILAGSSEAGECAECGAPWQRQTERSGETARERIARLGPAAYHAANGNGLNHAGGHDAGREVTTTGWAPSCACGATARPQLVLDPFAGSGTTLLVARKHGRRSVGIDLSADYLAIAARRLSQLSLLSEEAHHA